MLAVAVTGVALQAGSQHPVDIPDCIRGAGRVVVAHVARTEAHCQRNEYGDELIVSRVLFDVQETLKGSDGQVVNLVLEGGTLGEVTMRVSDLPELQLGERAVFFLERGEADEHVPHLRGQGILKLDDEDRVPGTSLTLDMIRQMARDQ